MNSGYREGEMTTNAAAAREFENSLGLDGCLIGVKYTNEPDPRAARDRRLAACEAIGLVRGEHSVISLSAETCNCWGGRYFLGLGPALKEQIIKAMVDDHKIFASEQLARKFLDDVPPPSGRGGFVVVAPLSDMAGEPDLVLSVCNTRQASKIVSLLVYSGHKLSAHNLVSSTCTSLASPMVTGEAHMNFITDHGKDRVPSLASYDFIIAMPLSKFKDALANVPHAGAVTRP
jgi:uncharacterized protein (DUF169 family)